MKNKCVFLVVCFSISINISFAKPVEFSFPKDIPKDSIGLFPLPAELNRFAVRDFALSPAMDELFITVESNRNTFSSILRFIKNKGLWQAALAPFSGNYSDLEPAFSPDGNTLYFVSNRPLMPGNKFKDFDIWKTEKKNGVWISPVNLGSPVNTQANEFYPSVTLSGDIYYTAEYENSKGKEDIFVSHFENGKYQAPVSLDSVNSPMYEFNAFVAPDASYIIFTSFGREDDMGGGDLYISKKDKYGNWTSPKNLGPAINSTALDYCPVISPDKKFFLFTSDRSHIKKNYPDTLTLDGFLKELGQLQNGKGNFYWIAADNILK